MIKVEFFHDVICSFCFPMSARMRKIAARYSNIEVIHRSFALGYTSDDFEAMFGSWAAVRPEVLSHWVVANQNDDEHRFNIEGMREQDFLFPTSRDGLVAAKAAGIVGSQDAYWDVFDALQVKLFVENKNIMDPEVMEEAVRSTNVPFDEWKEQFQKEETEQAVLEDIALARRYGLQGVPALVINSKYLVSGALSEETIMKTLEKAGEETGDMLLTLANDEMDNACIVEDGTWECK